VFAAANTKLPDQLYKEGKVERPKVGRLRAIELPANLQPQVAYGVAIVKGAKNHGAAKKFVDGLLSGAGAAALDKAGFEPPPA
jgi:hypothetical protein